MRVVPHLVTLSLSLLLIATPAYPCSKGTFASSLAASQVFFTGSAAADTVLAGPGSVDHGLGAGHYGRATERAPIHGQVIQVDRLGGPAAQRLPGDLREVVVVPWDYDAACQPLAWSRSARWVSPGTQGFYVATLRAPEHWAEGRPTVDLHNPWNLPYMGTTRIREMGRDTAVTSLLSPDQVFEFHQALPSRAEIDRHKEQALESLRTWVRSNPELAQRPPAEQLLRMVLYSVAQAELEEVDHPVLGTWRFTLRVPGDSAHIFYARTRFPASGRWTPSRTPAESAPGELRLPPAEGYRFLVAIARHPEDLPEVGWSIDYRQSYAYALADAEATDAGSLVWRGWIESSLIRQAVPDDPHVQSAAAQANERFGSRFRQGLPDETPARFARGVDGVLRVRQSFPLSGDEELILEGEQVSREVVRMPR